MPEPIRIALVDDDTDYANAQQRIAKDHGFDLTYYKTWDAAKDAIRARQFALVILDARGQVDDRSPGEDIAHLHQARTDLAEWRGQQIHIPYVICTGFDEGATANLRNEKRYLKGHEAEMYADIKLIVDRSSEAVLRSRYADVLAVFKLPCFDPAAESLFMHTLLYVEQGDRSGRDRFFMNPTRQVLEHWFQAAYRCGFLPNQLVRPDLNQRNCARFLSGEKVDFPSRATAHTRLWSELPVLPKLLSKALHNVLSVTNWGSHAILQDSTAEDTNSLADNEEAFREHGGGPYLLSTVVFQMMDLFVFFKRFVNEHPDPKSNRTWLREEVLVARSAPTGLNETKEFSRALVMKRDDKPFAFAGDCFLTNKLIRENDLRDGDLVSGVAKRVDVNGQVKWEVISLTKHS